MKKIKSFLKNQKLMVQIGIMLVILFVAATVGNIYLIYQNNMNMYLDEVADKSINMGSYLAKSMEEIDIIEWLVTYWTENANKLDITYDSVEATKLRSQEFDRDYPQYAIDSVTLEQIESMNEDAKKKYAEYMYMKLTDDFNRVKRSYNPTYVYCFIPSSESELFYYMTGMGEGQREQQGDSAYVLGTIIPYNPADFPVLKATIEEGRIQNKMEQPIKTGELSGFYHRFVPVVKNGKTLCVVAVTMETNTVRNEIRQKVMYIELVEIIVFIFIAITIFYVMNRVFIKPVVKLEKAMKEYENDKDSENISVKLNNSISRSEIGQLMNGFIDLTAAIKQHMSQIEKITSEQEKLKAELSLAASIQSDMLPKEFFDTDKLQVFGSMEPAKEVGGDFYDFFKIDEDHIAIVIGDVSGKGVPASLFMVKSMMAIRSFSVLGLGVNEVFERANNELCRGNDSELFTTSWLGVYEISTGILKYTEAGHDDPICIRSNGTTEWIEPAEKGLVLGSFEGMPYSMGETVLHKGETIILYTDGLPEANDINGEQYGMDRLENSVKENMKEANTRLTEFMKNVRSDVVKFAGEAEQFDDMTMFALTIK